MYVSQDHVKKNALVYRSMNGFQKADEGRNRTLHAPEAGKDDQELEAQSGRRFQSLADLNNLDPHDPTRLTQAQGQYEFRNETRGLPGRSEARSLPNEPSDDVVRLGGSCDGS